MRVLMISDHADPTSLTARTPTPLTTGSHAAGGQNVYVRILATELARAGVRVDIFTRRSSADAARTDTIAPGVTVVRLDAGPPGRLPRDSFLDVLPEFTDALCEHVNGQAFTYDLIQSNYWFSGIAGLRLRDLLGVPQVHMNCSFGHLRRASYGEWRNEFYAIREDAERRIARSVAATVVSSAWEGRLVRERFGADPDSIHEIPIGADRGFRPADRLGARRRLGIDERGPVVLFVGRPELRKGLMTLGVAWQTLRDRHPGMTLVMVGPDEASLAEDPKLRPLSDLLLEDPAPILAGPVPHTDLIDYYNAADVTVVPSHYEPYGIVAVEAMACGVPVVASRVGGLQDIVADGVTGLSVDPGNSTDLANAVSEIVAGKLGPVPLKAAVTRYRSHFSWARATPRYLQLYSDLVKSGVE
ncbi:glycosyltransferase [Sphaerisporangium rhizosphaerae]|uniref:Glycosyltransferase n=1 Tax=Sphaerisporangium rhizosphaerae TaxID=2269375 RepID=A0ABW2PGN6_9ACTN